MEPINYTSAFADLPSPNASFMQGVKDGAGIQQLQAQQQQAQAAQQQALQMKADLAALSQNPTTQAIGAMSIKYPQLSENFKRSFDMLDPGQKQARLDQATQVYAALHNKQPDIAVKLLNDQAEAQRNSGNEQDAKSAETVAALIQAHPEFAQTTAGLLISSALGPDKFAAAFPAIGGEQRAQEQAPADLAKKNADAVKAGAEATVAAGTIPALIQKPTEDNLTAQTKRRVDEFNAQIAGANSETERGRLTLERDKFIAEQAKTQQNAGSQAQEALDGANFVLETIARVKDHPGLNAGTGTGSSIRSFFSSSDGADFKRQAEVLKSQSFLSALSKMKEAGISLGQVTEIEGKKLEESIANLNPGDQSTSAYKNQVNVLYKQTEKFVNKIVASGKLPKAGGAFVMDHPAMGKVTDGDINRLLVQHPGATREQVIQFLNSSTGGASGNY